MQPEFSRPFSQDRIGTVATAHSIEATPEERAALAKRFELPSLDRLSASFTLRRVRGGRYIRLSGHVSGRAEQICGVSLAPLAAAVEQDIGLLLGPIGGGAGPDELDLPATGEDQEPWPEAGIDLGEIAAQYFSLALDPYPRAEGAEVPNAGPARQTGPDAKPDPVKPPSAANPFAALSERASKR